MIIYHTTVLDKDYTVLNVPLENFIEIQKFGLTNEFYGGNVTHIAKVKDSPIMLLIDNDTSNMKVVDVATESFEDVEYNVLKKYANTRGIHFDKEALTKEKLYDVLRPYVLDVKLEV